MDSITPSFLIENNFTEDCVIKGIPTGLYADRSSYGNEPILSITLENKLVCRASASMCSHTSQDLYERIRKIRERLGQSQDYAEAPTHELYVDNTQIALAASIIDSFIRSQSPIELNGIYQKGVFVFDFLRVGRYGFNFFRGSNSA